MADQVIQMKQGVARIIDGTANTANYVTCPFIEGTLSLPTGHDRPDELPQLSQGVANSYTHYVTGPDDEIVKRKDFSIELKLHSKFVAKGVLKAMSNPAEGTWQPDGSTTFSPVTSLGTGKNYAGSSFSFPVPADSIRAASLVNFEFLATISGGSNFGMKLVGVYFDKPVCDFANPVSTLKSKGEIYGAITPGITAFTTPVTELTIS